MVKLEPYLHRKSLLFTLCSCREQKTRVCERYGLTLRRLGVRRCCCKGSVWIFSELQFHLSVVRAVSAGRPPSAVIIWSQNQRKTWMNANYSTSAQSAVVQVFWSETLMKTTPRRRSGRQCVVYLLSQSRSTQVRTIPFAVQSRVFVENVLSLISSSHLSSLVVSLWTVFVRFQMGYSPERRCQVVFAAEKRQVK